MKLLGSPHRPASLAVAWPQDQRKSPETSVVYWMMGSYIKGLGVTPYHVQQVGGWTGQQSMLLGKGGCHEQVR